jgi:hypothetical protein
MWGSTAAVFSYRSTEKTRGTKAMTEHKNTNFYIDFMETKRKQYFTVLLRNYSKKRRQICQLHIMV